MGRSSNSGLHSPSADESTFLQGWSTFVYWQFPGVVIKLPGAAEPLCVLLPIAIINSLPVYPAFELVFKQSALFQVPNSL